MEPQGQSHGECQAVHRIEIGVDWPPGHVTVTLIDGQEPVLIDAGMVGKQAAKELGAGLETVGCSLSDIDHLVVTHPHVDHLGQIPALLDRADPTVYAPIGARERLGQDPSKLEAAVRENGTKAGLSGSALEMAVEKSVESLERNRTLLDPDSVDHWVEHGEEVTVGNRQLRAIHTPGHQADHCCYYGQLDGTSVLFSGDLLLAPFRSVVLHTGLDDGAKDGVNAFYSALDRVDGLDVGCVYPGHGSAHDQFEETIERSRKSLRRMLDHTREQVATGASTAMEIAIGRSGDREIQYVVPEVVGALGYLEAEGEIQMTVDDGVNQYYTGRQKP